MHGANPPQKKGPKMAPNPFFALAGNISGGSQTNVKSAKTKKNFLAAQNA
jgi:hypothetical protein